MGLGTARKMNQTLSILLDYGKLNARELLEFGRVDMGEIVEQSIQSLQGSCTFYFDLLKEGH